MTQNTIRYFERSCYFCRGLQTTKHILKQCLLALSETFTRKELVDETKSCWVKWHWLDLKLRERKAAFTISVFFVHSVHNMLCFFFSCDRTPLSMAVWSLTCFFVSASSNKWIRALYPKKFSFVLSHYRVKTHETLDIIGWILRTLWSA